MAGIKRDDEPGSDPGDIGDVVSNPDLLRALRQSKRESQNRFWARFGVTQTRGSRFELGQRLPPSVLILLRLYLNGVVGDGDLWNARRKRRAAGASAPGQARKQPLSRNRSARDAAT